MPGKDSKQDSSAAELQRLFERQSAWQKSRRNLSWPEKVRMVEGARESIQRIAGMRTGESTSSTGNRKRSK
jgi:hypothetical protein